MQKYIFLPLIQFKLFWKAKSLAGRLLFRLKRRAYGGRSKWQEEKAKSRSLAQLFRITGASVLWGILAAIVLQLIDSFLYPVYEYFGLSVADDSTYITLLATICGIGGVFIALYYTAISNIGGAIYAHVPNNIRDLLARERVGSVYMNIVAFITLLGLCLIGFRLLGLQRIFLAVPVMAILGGVCILGFVRLGQRAFYLFDPTVLANNIILELSHFVESATVQGFGWNNPSFQTHANRRAGGALDTLITLSSISSKADHLNGKPFAQLACGVSKFLAYYAKEKKRIPSDSKWYEAKYVYRDYYRTGDIEVSLSHDTGTVIQPTVEYNRLWVEEKLRPIILECIQVNLEKKRFQLVTDVLAFLDSYLSALAREGEVEQAFAFNSEIAATVLRGMLAQGEEHGPNSERVENLAIADCIANIPISIALSYLAMVSYLNKETIFTRLRHIQWHSPKGIYSRQFLAYCLPCLEWLKKRIRFELVTDGRPISPPWYQAELVLQAEAEQFKKNCEALFEASPRLYSKWLDLIAKKNRPWLEAAVISREWEYWHKILFQIEKLVAIWDDISGERHIDGIDWPETNIPELQRGISERQKKILKVMSEKGILSSLQVRPEDFPDYAGQFLHNVGEAIFSSMVDLDLNTLRSTFKPYFYGCLLQFDKLRPLGPVDAWRTQQAFKIAAAPIIDLMDLSGYGLLFSEFHGSRDLWEVVKGVWNDFLDAEKAPEKRAVFSASVGLTESAFELPHRGTLRTKWHIEVNRKLESLEREEVQDYRNYYRESVVIHQSPLVRVFAREMLGSFHDGIDIFISQYFYKRSDIQRLPLGWRRLELQNELAKEEERYREYMNAKKGESQ